MTFESEGLLIVAIYILLPPASYVVFSDNSGCHYAWFFVQFTIQFSVDLRRRCWICLFPDDTTDSALAKGRQQELEAWLWRVGDCSSYPVPPLDDGPG